MAEWIISLVALAISIFTFISSEAKDWRSERKDRKFSTLEAFNRLQEQALDKLNFYTPERILEIIPDSHSDEYMLLSGYVARIEHFAVGVNQNIYNRKVVYELAADYLDGAIRKKIEPLIAKKNYSKRDYYENIHKLYVWMDKERVRKEKKEKRRKTLNGFRRSSEVTKT